MALAHLSAETARTTGILLFSVLLFCFLPLFIQLSLSGTAFPSSPSSSRSFPRVVFRFSRTLSLPRSFSVVLLTSPCGSVAEPTHIMLNIQPPPARGGGGENESDDEGSQGAQRRSLQRQMDTFGGTGIASPSGREEYGDDRSRQAPSAVDPSYRISPPGTPKEEAKFEERFGPRGRRREEPDDDDTSGGPPSTRPPPRQHQVAVRYAAPSISTKGKFLRVLPVVFVLLLIACLGCIYILFHIVPLLQGGSPRDGSSHKDGARFARGLGEGVVFGVLLLLQLICFFLAVFTSPGHVPPEFSSEEEEGAMLLQQTVRSRARTEFPHVFCVTHWPGTSSSLQRGYSSLGRAFVPTTAVFTSRDIPTGLST